MKPLAKFITILGDANRLSIIHAIGGNELSVTEIIAETDLSQTLVSFHLRTLRDARVVATRREGPFIYYRLTAPSLLDILGPCYSYRIGKQFPHCPTRGEKTPCDGRLRDKYTPGKARAKPGEKKIEEYRGQPRDPSIGGTPPLIILAMRGGDLITACNAPGSVRQQVRYRLGNESLMTVII
jgi:DNA-binding transcriptional ArsR family regulator